MKWWPEMRLYILAIGKIGQTTIAKTIDLANQAYPTDTVVPNTYPIITSDDVTNASLFIGEYLKQSTTVLIIVERSVYSSIEALLSEDLNLDRVIEYTSDRQLYDLLIKKWHIGEFLFDQKPMSSYTDQIEEAHVEPMQTTANAGYTYQTGNSKQLQQRIAQLEAECEQYKQSLLQDQSTVGSSDIKAKEEQLIRVTSEKLALEERYRKQTKSLSKVQEEKELLTQKVNKAYNDGYTQGVSDTLNDKDNRDIFDIMRDKSQADAGKLPRFVVRNHYDNIRLMYSATSRTQGTVYKAILEDLRDEDAEQSTRFLFIDLSAESYIAKYTSITESVNGYLWLEKPNYKTLHRYICKTKYDYIDVLTPYVVTTYNTQWLYCVDWQDILDELTKSGYTVCMYFGNIFDTHNLILCNTLAKTAKKTTVYLDGYNLWDVQYFERSLYCINNKRLLTISLYRISSPNESQRKRADRQNYLKSIESQGCTIEIVEYDFESEGRRR